jgi:DNA repair protein RadC
MALPFTRAKWFAWFSRPEPLRSLCITIPSGIAEPSQADELLTRRLREALQLIDVRVLDRLIIGDTKEYSFAETGLL